MISSSLLIIYASDVVSNYLDNLFYKTSFSKIKNRYYFLYFIKEIIRFINTLEDDEERKILFIGLLEMHKIECSNPICLTKNDDKIYSQKMNIGQKESHNINNKIFLNTFIIQLLYYWIKQNIPF